MSGVQAHLLHRKGFIQVCFKNQGFGTFDRKDFHMGHFVVLLAVNAQVSAVALVGGCYSRPTANCKDCLFYC